MVRWFWLTMLAWSVGACAALLHAAGLCEAAWMLAAVWVPVCILLVQDMEDRE